MADILDVIVARVREQLVAVPPDLPRLRELALAWQRRDFRAVIETGPRPALIAEFKRRSPSKGALREGAVLRDYCSAYEKAGASALSILTNPDFGGNLADLLEARETVRLPLLRKDFIVDERQLLEAAANGADCVLLIARIVAPAQLVELASAARGLHLQTLVEVYEEFELESALDAKPDLLGQLTGPFDLRGGQLKVRAGRGEVAARPAAGGRERGHLAGAGGGSGEGRGARGACRGSANDVL